MKNEAANNENKMKIVMRKTYVQVTADFYPDGRLRPSVITWSNGKTYHIGQIKQIQRMESQRVPGKGICYTCMVWGHPCRLFYEENYKWFMEEPIVVMGGSGYGA